MIKERNASSSNPFLRGNRAVLKQITVQNGLCGEIRVSTDKSTQSLVRTESIPGTGNQDSGISRIIQAALVAVHIILPLANGNEADYWGQFYGCMGQTGKSVA